MIRIFDIKKHNNNLISDDLEKLNKYNSISILPREEIFSKYKTTVTGLNRNKASERLKRDGKNVVIRDDEKSVLYFILNSFKDEFIIILLILAIINFCLGDHLGSVIIVAIAIISALLRFFQEYSVYKFNRKLRQSIYSTVCVIRSGKEVEIKVEDVVVGDVVKLNAGTIIPADLRIVESKDLFINQSVFTGESAPIEKLSEDSGDSKEIFNINNICLMGCSVISGNGTGVVIDTGFNTYLGEMGREIHEKKEVTNFDKGIKDISNLLIKYMIVVCIVVIIIDGFIKNNFAEALLFALSVAVGITPSMLPMIVNVNLTKGSRSLASKKTLVKKVESIQNLGAIDILCTDKTGTLTENKIILQKYIDVNGNENIDILDYAFLNSYYSTGIKNLVDRAVISYGKEHKLYDILSKYKKIDEIPFDYTRKKVSVIVQKDDHYRMITKGALEEIIHICDRVQINGKISKINDSIIKKVQSKATELASDGMQVIALAYRNEYPGSKEFDSSYEKNMIFVGFVGFLDPAKKDVKNTLEEVVSCWC